VRDALRERFGLSLMPYPYVAGDLREGRLQRTLEDWSTVETHVLCRVPVPAAPCSRDSNIQSAFNHALINGDLE
jgi:DNA-binding transcriptional LysR family regulator